MTWQVTGSQYDFDFINQSSKWNQVLHSSAQSNVFCFHGGDSNLILYTQCTGQLPTIKMKLVHNFTHRESCGSSTFHCLAKSASTKQSMVNYFLRDRESFFSFWSLVNSDKFSSQHFHERLLGCV